MSCTGRPSKPPLALMSSSQIFMATSADLPLAARPPVSAMPKPILIGSAAWASRAAPPATSAAAAIIAAKQRPAIRYPLLSVIAHPSRFPYGWRYLMLVLSALASQHLTEPSWRGKAPSISNGEEAMRLVAFDDAGKAKLGVLQGETVVDLGRAAPSLPHDLTGMIRAGSAAFAAASDAARQAKPDAHHPLKSLRFRPPTESAGKIICLGLNYVDHAAEGGHAKPDYPSIFLRCNTSLVAHGEAIWRPLASTKL